MRENTKDYTRNSSNKEFGAKVIVTVVVPSSNYGLRAFPDPKPTSLSLS